MWRTEVNIGARMWAISTARVGMDSTGAEVFETTVIEPCGEAAESVRHSSPAEQARRIHDLFVADYGQQPGAVVVERLSRPWRF
ncbi:hypothetical protein [Saccharopolyspora mangrovi]|uniref:Uncharacterized protein n=1 Tax=Saccharopolyspora mangrovi TaxID=3082379 RepID=A0ABU6ABP5_9PSEU|nr:hypothetical protein [Saccharopolyspora sp. S2-29]MEB3368982.1 hypothetical protein [Saccharopolyspora sp. S2-29]